jgi:hypothetical protein
MIESGSKKLRLDYIDKENLWCILQALSYEK